MISALFFPIIPWLLQLALFAWFLGVSVYLVTNGIPKYKVIDVPAGGDPYNLTDGDDCDPMVSAREGREGRHRQGDTAGMRI